MTTITPAFVPLVHQSFSPLSMKELPSGVGSAWVSIVAGSDPAPDSVRAKAEISPPATRGKYLLFCPSVPKSKGGGGPPIDWGAESGAVRLPQYPPSTIAAQK